MPSSPVSSVRPAPGLKLRFPVEEDCSAVLWCVKLVATVPAVTTVLPPTESSFSRDRFLDPAVWQGFHRRLLPLQNLRSPDPPRTRSRNTTAKPLRDQKYQFQRKKEKSTSGKDESQGLVPRVILKVVLLEIKPVYLSDNASGIRTHEKIVRWRPGKGFNEGSQF